MQPVISEKDYKELDHILVKKETHETKFLKTLLKRLRIVKDNEVSKKTIRLNSLVVLWNSLLKKIVKFRIVSPGKEDLKAGKISVLSPISMAIMGHQENDTLTLNTPGLKKELRVIEVKNE